jgi:hypothetical protein
MHPRILARDGCSGGTCPAVYDLDDLPGDLVIQGKQASPELLSRLTGVADDENAVIIGRDLVRVALRPAAEPVDVAELMEQLRAPAYTAFRLETLQHYQGLGRDDEWVDLLKAARRFWSGRKYQRVHVVTEPLTRSMRQELTEGYEPNVSAGEDIGIIGIADGFGAWPEDVPRFDFWLLDSSRLYVLRYASDDGEFLGADRVTDPARIMEACKARDAALHRAMPWSSYVSNRPELQRRLAQ